LDDDLLPFDDTTGGEAWHYVRALNWALPTLVVVVIGDVTPVTMFETVYCSLIFILGLVINASIIGNIATNVANIGTPFGIFRDRRQSLEKLMAHNNTPHKLRNRAREYLQYSWENAEGVDANTVINDLPPSLQNDVQFALMKDLFVKSPVFADVDTAILRNLAHHVRLVYYTPGDDVAVVGGAANLVYFVRKGSLDMVHNGNVVATLGENSSFGETALVNDAPHPAVIRARDFTELFELHRVDFLEVMRAYPHEYEEIQDVLEEQVAHRRKEMVKIFGIVCAKRNSVYSRRISNHHSKMRRRMARHQPLKAPLLEEEANAVGSEVTDGMKNGVKNGVNAMVGAKVGEKAGSDGYGVAKTMGYGEDKAGPPAGAGRGGKTGDDGDINDGDGGDGDNKHEGNMGRCRNENEESDDDKEEGETLEPYDLEKDASIQRSNTGSFILGGGMRVPLRLRKASRADTGEGGAGGGDRDGECGEKETWCVRSLERSRRGCGQGSSRRRMWDYGSAFFTTYWIIISPLVVAMAGLPDPGTPVPPSPIATRIAKAACGNTTLYTSAAAQAVHAVHAAQAAQAAQAALVAACVAAVELKAVVPSVTTSVLDGTLEAWYNIDLFVELWFIVDIVLRVVIFPFEQRGRTVRTTSGFGRSVAERRLRCKMRTRYLQGSFVTDLIGCVPSEIIIRMGGLSHTQYAFLRLFRLVRLPRLIAYNEMIGKVVARRFNIHAQSILVFRVLFLYLLMQHIYGCAWIVIHRFVQTNHLRTWATKDGLCDAYHHDYCSVPFASLYSRALYFVVTVTSTVGYGDIRPFTLFETIFNVIVVWTGATFFAAIIGAFQAFFLVLDTSGADAFQQVRRYYGVY
jgi:CRP-like cAMP-binding protein